MIIFRPSILNWKNIIAKRYNAHPEECNLKNSVNGTRPNGILWRNRYVKKDNFFSKSRSRSKREKFNASNLFVLTRIWEGNQGKSTEASCNIYRKE
jgi:hypothetical protein